MMKYLYFPGCSLKSSGRHYEESMLAVFKKLGIDVTEIDDWNCCGATNYMAMNELKAVAITTRNLALAEKMIPTGEVHIIAPCNACYMGLLKTQNYLATQEEMRNNVLASLKNAGLTFEGRVKVRHPLDVIVNDFGLENLKKAVVKPLKDVRVCSYYGCQVSRPIAEFDDPRDPVTMDQIVMTLGATAIDWPLKTHCCSGSMISTIPDTGLRMNYLILKEAKERKAQVVITACPLCQFNLECFQKKINRRFDDAVTIPVAFFSQLMGMALGIEGKELGLQRLFVKTDSIIA